MVDRPRPLMPKAPVEINETDKLQISLAISTIAQILSQLRISTNNGILAMLELSVGALAGIPNGNKDLYLKLVNEYLWYARQFSETNAELLMKAATEAMERQRKQGANVHAPMEVYLVYKDKLEDLMDMTEKPKTPTKH